jgi:hypothetical protein
LTGVTVVARYNQGELRLIPDFSREARLTRVRMKTPRERALAEQDRLFEEYERILNRRPVDRARLTFLRARLERVAELAATLEGPDELAADLEGIVGEFQEVCEQTRAWCRALEGAYGSLDRAREALLRAGLPRVDFGPEIGADL